MTALGWLNYWIDDNIVNPGYSKKSEMRDLAAACAADAGVAGISIADLKAAAGGDIVAHLLKHQNILTNDYVDGHGPLTD
jgi:hypothetical protein